MDFLSRLGSRASNALNGSLTARRSGRDGHASTTAAHGDGQPQQQPPQHQQHRDQDQDQDREPEKRSHRALSDSPSHASTSSSASSSSASSSSASSSSAKVKELDGSRTDAGSMSGKSVDDDSERRRSSVVSQLVEATGSRLKAGGRNVRKFGKFVGPGFMIAVAYIDPGNYATDVAAGASYRFQLLVMILVSNLIAIFLQSLCIKLGSVTGLNLAENCRAHLPRWLNFVLWVFAEGAIIATDIAEVIGTAIALNLLLHIPLVAGCAISIVDVLFILIFYRPSGSMRGLRVFEFGVMLLVLGVVVCFCVELSLISVPDLGPLFRGYLPSHALIESQGLYQACGILGATVMPHSLYLGSGIVQPRLREYDEAHGNVEVLSDEPPPASLPTTAAGEVIDTDAPKYKPTLAAIKSCMRMSMIELALSLFTFALFVNSAILIVAGASLSENPDAGDADLFGIHDLLSHTLAPAAGTVFALALLLSGTSAGIVCTIAGQMVAEGQLRWTIKPWVRRLVTRTISITPSIIIAGAVGRDGLSAALTGSQVALSVILPFTSAPLIYFTCRNKIMSVQDGTRTVGMRNNWFVAFWGILFWLLIVVMNVALLVLLGLGQGD